MQPIPFEQQNIVFAENQDEYLDLPAMSLPNGLVVSCWKGSFTDRLRVLFGGKIWLMVETFGAPLQPMSMQTDSPFDVPLEKEGGDG